MLGIDVLAFGAHPDDVEVGVGGILGKYNSHGYSTVICNLTQAELSSNGTVENRQKETRLAAKILGVQQVINLGFPDRDLSGSRFQIDKVVQLIREIKPRIVLAPYWEDRHPDHVNCSKIVQEAIFDAAISKKITENKTDPHRISKIYYYFINNVVKEPNIIIDISHNYHQKMKAILAYKSQFIPQNQRIQTPINSPTYIKMIQSRDTLWGHQIGVSYGEGLIYSNPISLEWL